MRNTAKRPAARPRRARRDRVQSVQRALAVLRTFTHDVPVLGITEIARRVGLTKGIVFRSVQTLVESGFLDRSDQDGTYQIGLAAFEVGSLYRVASSLERIAPEPMRRLASQQGHNVYLGIRDGRHVVYVLTVDGTGPIKVHAAIGSRQPAHATAMGKVILAHLDPAEVHRLLSRSRLEAMTRDTITDIAKLERQLRQVRRNGFAINSGETFAGVGSVAAPVRDRSGVVVAAVSNGFPLAAGSAVDWGRIAADVVSCAGQISQRLVSNVGSTWTS